MDVKVPLLLELLVDNIVTLHLSLPALASFHVHAVSYLPNA